MIHTPLSSSTDTELIMAVNNAENPSWLEIELAQRLESLHEDLDDLKEDSRSEIYGYAV